MPPAPFVLILLNDLMFRVKIEDSLKTAGFDRAFVAGGGDLYSTLRERRPDLIILDLNYQAGKPLEVVSTLKKNEETRGIPLLAYVSHVQVELKRAALAQGCDRVVARSALSQNLPRLLSEFARQDYR